MRDNVASKMNALVNRAMNSPHDAVPPDHSVYPDLDAPPDVLPTPQAKADYVYRASAAFDFGIFPEGDWDHFATWQAIFDAYPLPDSPAYHTFRARFGWPPVARGTCELVPPWRVQDLREGRTDPCKDTV